MDDELDLDIFKITLENPLITYTDPISAQNKNNKFKQLTPGLYLINRMSLGNTVFNLVSTQKHKNYGWSDYQSLGRSLGSSKINKILTKVNEVYNQIQNTKAGMSVSDILINRLNRRYGSGLDSVTTNVAGTLSTSNNKSFYAMNKDPFDFYISNLTTGSSLNFYMNPDDFSDDTSVNYSSTSIRGNTFSYRGYQNTSDRSFSFNFDIYDDLLEDGIQNTIAKLRSFLYPEYDGPITPSVCFLKFGEMYEGKGLLTRVGITRKKPYREGIFIYASINIGFVELSISSRSASEVSLGGGKL